MADTTTTYHAIQLSFEIGKLFDYIKLQSLYAGSGVSNEAGATQEFTYALTDNERDFFDIVLKQAASRVYDELSQDTHLSTDPIRYGVLDPNTNRTMLYYELYVPEMWDSHQVFGLHTAAETALTSYILKAWYNIRGAANLFQVANANYNEHISLVKNLLNRRIAPVKKVYRYLG